MTALSASANKYVFSCSSDCTIIQWCADSLQSLAQFPFRGVGHPLSVLAVHDTIVLGFQDTLLRALPTTHLQHSQYFLKGHAPASAAPSRVCCCSGSICGTAPGSAGHSVKSPTAEAPHGLPTYGDWHSSFHCRFEPHQHRWSAGLQPFYIFFVIFWLKVLVFFALSLFRCLFTGVASLFACAPTLSRQHAYIVVELNHFLLFCLVAATYLLWRWPLSTD